MVFVTCLVCGKQICPAHWKNASELWTAHMKTFHPDKK